MSTRRKHFFLFFLLLITTPSWARGGADGGGGGKGVLCDGKLRTLDLYEAEELYRLHINREQPDYQSALKAYFPKLVYYGASPDGGDSEAFTDFALSMTPYNTREINWESLDIVVTHRLKDIPDGEHLPLTPDATIHPLPSGCKIVQVLTVVGPTLPHGDEAGDYNGPPKKILRDAFYWKMLSPTDQVALILHEFLYNLQGLSHGGKSDDVRRVIGLVFSDQELLPFRKAVDEAYSKGGFNNFFRCGAILEAPFRYWIRFDVINESRNGRSGIGIYFDRIYGEHEILETSAFVPGLSALKTFSADRLDLKVDAVTAFTGRKTNVELKYKFPHVDFRAWSDGETPPNFIELSCDPIQYP